VKIDTLEKVPPHVAIAAGLGGKANPSHKWRVALSLVEVAYFCSRRPAPICFIKGSTEVDALRSSIQVPLRLGLSD
jgi:hypothetical protein